ncbi:Glycosyltransferase, GT2 family [Singulisphaera sp. GP187]|uniref:glycosyltransferase family 2 protein n=1 Tax=Singulisphaera sp. GP187 TaxID=1882752 RepID=UPI00092B83BB|nr:glycosyltransferase [Singulisphaera sp. GP187]SIO10143.1 Glycosyltransferase, GT2 family [Singulisphaera sp. GP187]
MCYIDAMEESGDGPVISVIIPVLDALDDLPGLLDALLRQSLPIGRFEVIFVDNGSTDGSLDWLALNCRAGVRFLCCHDRRGSYAARNVGLNSARSENLAFTDSDGRPDPNWLEAGLKALTSAPRVAGSIELVHSEFPSINEFVDAGRFLRQRRFVSEGFGATANLFVHREVFDRIGAFEERLISGGDHEFGQRATATGFPIIYAADTIVRHPCRKTLRSVSKKAFRVGFGFGQSMGLPNKSMLRSSFSRVTDRVKLSSGEALKNGRKRPSDRSA